MVTTWYHAAVDEAARLLEASLDTGLTEAEAAARLERYGPNVIEAERERPWLALLLHQFRDPLIYILVTAAVVTLVLREFIDAGVIIAVILLNATIGFLQELRAQKAVRALASMTAPKALALREGTVVELESRVLVPGDIVVLASGAAVPADVRLTVSRGLEVDESALTGESLPVRKHVRALDGEDLVAGDQLNMAFAGTIVRSGRGRGLVVCTGAATELGRIATAVREVTETATPLQHKIERLGRAVGVIVAGLAGVVVLIGLFHGRDALDIFMTAVATAVATVPEGLPIVITVTLAVGVRRMAARNAIVRSLPAVETLGSTTVIGSDKTGTLTQNEMTVRAIVAGGRSYELSGVGYTAHGEILRAGRPVAVATEPALAATLVSGVLANEAGSLERSAQSDPTELALLAAAAKGGIEAETERARHAELDILPFEPEYRFMATLNAEPDGGSLVHVKGAPEVVVARCTRELADDGTERPFARGAAEDAAAVLAARGLRVLAVARGPSPPAGLSVDSIGDLVFLGLQGMEDPVRPDAPAAVGAARAAGVRVLMLTGDHARTAGAIGRQLGLADEATAVIEGRELEGMSDADLDAALAAGSSVFARVAPEHKLRIVMRLRRHGEIVAVTGDGVNDAPALRAAHLGVAMGASGTDVAREASDLVLADDNFATITAAIEEGRIVFANIRKVTFFLLSTGVGMVLTILAALVLDWPLPALAAQILWINLVTNGLQDVALAFEPGEPGLLRRPPRHPREGILSAMLLRRLGLVGALLAAGTLFTFHRVLESTGDLDLARTAAVTQMVIYQFFHVFNCRSLDRSIARVPLFSNRFLFVSLVAALLAHLAALYWAPLQTVFRTVPLGGDDWLWIIAIAAPVILGGELDKWWNRRRGRSLG
jgi:magnesium-transporting ATPase (P-type)